MPVTQWNDEKNARRCDLIDRQIEGTIAPVELQELDVLQAQLRRHLEEVAPYDLSAASEIHQQLLEKKLAADWGMNPNVKPFEYSDQEY